MTTETIQNAAVAYQMSGTTGDSAQSISRKGNEEKREVRMSRLKLTPTAAEQKEQLTTADGEKAVDKVQITEQVSDSALKKAVEDINRKSSSTEAIFGYHEGTNRVTIKIIDKETREVKKEYPAEETLDMIQKVWETAGLMVDAKG